MKRKPMRSMTAASWLIACLMLLSWLISMVCLTLIQANHMYDGLSAHADSLSAYALAHNQTVWEKPEYQTYRLLDRIRSRFSTSDVLLHSGPSDWWELPSVFHTSSAPIQTALTLTGPDWSLESGDYLFFSPYYTQQQWDAHMDGTGSLSGQTGYIRLYRDADDPFRELYRLYQESNWLSDVRAMRITGYMQGEEILPVRIDYVSEEAFFKAVDETAQYYTDENGDTYMQEPDYGQVVSLLEAKGLIEWQKLAALPADSYEPLQVIYAIMPDMTVCPSEPVTYRGQTYESLLALIKAVDLSQGTYEAGEHSLTKLILFDQQPAKTDASGEQVAIVTGFYAEPLKATVQSLWPIYLLTGWVTLCFVLYIIHLLRARLIRPLREAVTAIEDDWNSYAITAHPMWQEPAQLRQLVDAESDYRRKTKDTLTRLETALGYAKTAEENRRQLTSNIAHELKTPLAIVHSYAEGLKEHIAEEKRDQYLDTILSEAQRMDTMVMELLDLSRLEAGKVTLTRTDFALDQLARTVWEPFVPLAEEKQLQVCFALEESCRIHADEARLTQVLRNLMSNAVRYTPEGGRVILKASTGRKKTCFSIENTAEAFTSEALSKVWESFYRTDKARSGKGTGLGLAIVKSIIGLHGGSCYVKNTQIGVEFGFHL